MKTDHSIQKLRLQMGNDGGHYWSPQRPEAKRRKRVMEIDVQDKDSAKRASGESKGLNRT